MPKIPTRIYLTAIGAAPPPSNSPIHIPPTNPVPFPPKVTMTFELYNYKNTDIKFTILSTNNFDIVIGTFDPQLGFVSVTLQQNEDAEFLIKSNKCARVFMTPVTPSLTPSDMTGTIKHDCPENILSWII